VVERHGDVARTAGPGKPAGRVDRVIHSRGAVGVADDVDHDQVRSPLRELLVVEEAARGEVGEEEAGLGSGRGDQRLHQFAAFVRAKVDLDRTLALVESGPEQALAAGGHRPARAIEAAADRVEADYVCSELRHRHTAQGRSDEGRALDDPHTLEYSRHLVVPPCQS